MKTPSDALVFFGATGDLAYKKIFPALQSMVRRGHLDTPVIGVAKAGWNRDQLVARARESCATEGGGVDEAAFAKLARQLRYVDGDYQDAATFAALKRELGSAQEPTHYLAIPPSMFPTVVEGLGKVGAAEHGRVVVEKPFGRDERSAHELNCVLHRVFDEHEIFRIDHYLGKEAVQNLQVFRFANTFLEPIWNRNYVESIEITMAESFGVKGRGKFYDEAGTIRDVVQNHLLQVVGYLCMEPPVGTWHDAIRDEQVKVFRSIRPLDPTDVVRGQFRGYRKEPGVAPDSQVETYVALRLWIDSWRWSGVPVLIRAGKCLTETVTEAVVTLREPPLAQAMPADGNFIRFRLGPEVIIGLGARVKAPGETWTPRQAELVFVDRETPDEMEAYERLLGDAMAGDQMLFTRQDAVEAAWKIVQPVLGNVTPIEEYECGTWGPRSADRLAEEIGGWHPPADCRPRGDGGR